MHLELNLIQKADFFQGTTVVIREAFITCKAATIEKDLKSMANFQIRMRTDFLSRSNITALHVLRMRF